MTGTIDRTDAEDMLLALSVYFAVAGSGNLALTNEDRAVLTAAADYFAHSTPFDQASEGYRFYVASRTILVTERDLRTANKAGGDVAALDFAELHKMPEYSELLARSSSRLSVGALHSSNLRIVAEPTESYTCKEDDRIYESALYLSAPGYSTDGEHALVYISAIECGETKVLVRLKHTAAGWEGEDSIDVAVHGE